MTKKNDNKQKDNNDFLAVMYEGKKDQVSVEVIDSGRIDTTQIDIEIPDRFAIRTKHGDKEKIYYIRGQDYFRYYSKMKKGEKNLVEINNLAEESAIRFKQAWVEFGTNILAVHGLKSYKLAEECSTFEDFCSKRLQMHQSTVYEIMNSTLFLRKAKPELYAELMQGNTREKVKDLPSYRCFYLLAKKKKKLEKQEKLLEVLDYLMGEKPTTQEFQKKLKEYLPEKESSKIPIADCEALIKRIKQIENAPDDISKLASQLLEKLQKLENK